MEWLFLKGLVEYCWINKMVLSTIIYPKKNHYYESQTLSIFFIFSPNGWGLEDRVTSNCKMFEGRISFIHVGWLLRLFRLISWCWCRRVKNRWWDLFHLWQCGTSPGGCNLRLTKQKVVFNHLCLMLKLSCEDPSFACHVLGLFLQIPPGLEHNLFDSIACWTLHKLKRRFRFLIGQRHGGEKKIGFNDAKKQQMICLDVSQWHAIKSCHVLSYLQGGPLPVTNRLKTHYE